MSAIVYVCIRVSVIVSPSVNLSFYMSVFLTLYFYSVSRCLSVMHTCTWAHGHTHPTLMTLVTNQKCKDMTVIIKKDVREKEKHRVVQITLYLACAFLKPKFYVSN